MEFAAPHRLWLLALLPLMWVAWRWAQGRRQARLRRAMAIETRSFSAVGIDARKLRLKTILWTTALGLLTLALAGPRLGFDWIEHRRRGIDVVFAVDVSRSMLATDVSPSRLERARREIIDLLAAIQGQRVALVAFAGRAFVQCPLTADDAVLRLFLPYLDPQLIPVQGTNIGAALRAGLEALKDGGASAATGGGRTIVLFTDGEDLAGQVEGAIKLAKDQGVVVHTVAIGSVGGSPIPDNGGLVKDASGQVVLTRPDLAALAKVSEATGGLALVSEAGDGDTRRLVSDGLQRGGDREREVAREKVWHERYGWLVGGALLLLAVETLMTDVVATSLVLALIFGIPKAKAADAAAGARAFENGDFGAAEESFLSAEVESPDDPRHAYNRGVAAYRLGKFEVAADAFAKAARSPDATLKGASLFNLGNSEAQAKRYDEAIKAYEDTQAATSDEKLKSAAAENLEFVRKLKETKQDQKSDQQRQDQKQDRKEARDEPESSSDTNSENKENKKDQQANNDNSQDTKDQQGSNDDQKGEGDQRDDQKGSPPQSADQKQDQEKNGEPSAAGESKDKDATANDQGATQASDGQMSTGTDTHSAADNQSAAPAPQEDVTSSGTGSAAATDAKAAAQAGVRALIPKGEADRTLDAVTDQIGKYVYGEAVDAPGSAPPSGRDW